MNYSVVALDAVWAVFSLLFPLYHIDVVLNTKTIVANTFFFTTSVHIQLLLIMYSNNLSCHWLLKVGIWIRYILGAGCMCVLLCHLPVHTVLMWPGNVVHPVWCCVIMQTMQCSASAVEAGTGCIRRHNSGLMLLMKLEASVWMVSVPIIMQCHMGLANWLCVWLKTLGGGGMAWHVVLQTVMEIPSRIFCELGVLKSVDGAHWSNFTLIC